MLQPLWYSLFMNIVIVGGGFGGVKAAIEMAKKNIGKITLISDKKYLINHATLYTIVSGCGQENSTIELSEIVKNYKNLNLKIDTVESIDVKNQKIIGNKRQYSYDKVVFSLGLINHFTSANMINKHSYASSSLESLSSLSKDLHDALVRDDDKCLNCVIVGGGMAGVELAGALSEYVKQVKEAHQLFRTSTKISLIESRNHILPAESKSARQIIKNKLGRLGINLLIGKSVSKFDKLSLSLGRQNLPMDFLVWATGGKNHHFFSDNPKVFKLSKTGKVLVNQNLQAYPDIYVIGDNAATKSSGSVSSAFYDARYLADLFKRTASGRPTKIRKKLYTQPIKSIPLTRFWAYAQTENVYATGFTGSLVRRVLELYNLWQILPQKQAYTIWRGSRTKSKLCNICKKY